MSAVLWTETALNGLSHIQAYIEQFNPRAAAHVAASLRADAEGLANFPHRGRLVPGARPDTRELVTDYPYIIRYRVTGDTVNILRIRHTARRPTTP